MTEGLSRRPPLIEADVVYRNFPAAPFLLRQNLASHPLFEPARIRKLLAEFPAERVEVRRPASAYERSSMAEGVPAAEAFDRLADEPFWINAHRVHEQDPGFAELMRDYLRDLSRICLEIGDEVYDFTCDLIFSSPNAVVHFHSDPDQSVLNQIRGRKTVFCYPASILPEQEIETLVRTEDHGATPHRPEYESRVGEPLEIGPGDSAFLPLYAPHRVTNGGEVCWSMSIGFHTRASLRRKNTHLLNGRLRARGLTVAPFGRYPLLDRAKATAYGAARAMKGHSRDGVLSLTV